MHRDYMFLPSCSGNTKSSPKLGSWSESEKVFPLSQVMGTPQLYWAKEHYILCSNSRSTFMFPLKYAAFPSFAWDKLNQYWLWATFFLVTVQNILKHFHVWVWSPNASAALNSRSVILKEPWLIPKFEDIPWILNYWLSIGVLLL